MKTNKIIIIIGTVILLGVAIWSINLWVHEYPKPYAEKMRFQDYYNDTLIIVDFYTYGKVEKRINDNDVQWGQTYTTSLKWVKMMADKTYYSKYNIIGIGVFDIFPSMIDEGLNPILKDNSLSGITIDSLKVKDVVYMPINE